MKLPEPFVIKMKALLKDEFDEFINSFDDEKFNGLRANTLKIRPEELLRKFNNLEGIGWCKEGFYYTDELRPSKHPYYHAGLYYIQEPSAMSTGAVIDICENDRVLDLCAAPGGKSTQIAARLNGSGILVSNDVSASRCKALIKNIELFGITNCIITNETPEKLAPRFESFFNKIIVDAPCSGEGMFRKNKEAVRNWKENRFCGLQRNILQCAGTMLSAGGLIVYSTCTFAPEENEGIIDEFLKNNSDMEIVTFDKSGGFEDGRPEWIDGCSHELTKAGRLMPHKVKGEGHFLCLLRKKGSADTATFPQIKTALPNQLEYYYEFAEKYLNKRIDGNLKLHGHSLFSVPLGLDTDGLRIMRSGFYLGDIKTKRFEPSWALALALKKENARLVVDFELSDNKVNRYLNGESFEVDASDGWNLVCVDSFPLGWGKVQNGRMKNKLFF